jgi:hypothetical protein
MHPRYVALTVAVAVLSAVLAAIVTDLVLRRAGADEIQAQMMLSRIHTLERRVSAIKPDSGESAPTRPPLGSDASAAFFQARADRLARRLQQLETKVDDLGQALPSQAATGESPQLPPRSSLKHRLSAADSTSEQALAGAFVADSESDSSERADIISDSFHATAKNLQLDDLQCRQSICRLTYSDHSSTTEVGGAGRYNDSAFVDQLSQDLGDADLDIRYTTNEYGQKVMYISVH